MKIINVSEELIAIKGDLEEKVYLSDLPEFKNNDISILYNTIFNKSVTGIGGTTLALKSTENIIILMPFVEVVNNKENAVGDSFIVKSGVTVQSITHYLKTTKIRKIVSTYDGLKKIIEGYSRAGLNIYKDFLLVDEWQVLFQQYGLRTNIIKYLLSESTLFERKCFMTATPIKKEYWFKEILDLEELVLEYDLPPIILKHFKTKNIIDEVVAIIRTNEENKNLHFFINSVETIKNLMDILKLEPGEVRIICSNQEKNSYKLKGYKIESTKDPVKMINFYTSTCFEGCDIFDKDGKIFVLCDGSKAHTLVDITTTLPQIAGRIRDIEDTSVNLIYSSTRYINVTQEEFNATIDENIRIGREIVRGITTIEALEALDTNYINSRYLIVDNNKLDFEEIFLNIDKANFEISKTYNYKANIVPSKVFSPVKVTKPWAEEIEKITSERILKLSFKEQCLLYIESKGMKYSLPPKFDKIVINAVDKLGIDRLDELYFHKGNINKELIKLLDIPESIKVMKMLNLNKLQFYGAAELKSKFSGIYSKLKIKATPKGTDIKKYYEVKDSQQRVNGKVVGGFIILSPKMVFNLD